MFSLVLSGVLLGCGRSEDSDSPGTEAPDDESDTAAGRDTSAPEPEVFVPEAFTVYAMFAVDDDGALHAYTIDGVERAPWVAIELVDAQAQRCSVTFEIDPAAAPLVAWSFEDETPEADGQVMNHSAFLVPDDAPAQTLGCELWDEARYGDVVELVRNGRWGIGVGDLRVDVEAEVRDNGGWLEDLLDAGQLAGASWQADVFDPTTWASHTAFAAEAPPDFTVTFDDEGLPVGLVDAADYTGGGGWLPRGFYVLQPIYVWDFAAYFE